MIYDLAQAVKTRLRAKLFPYPIVYGPERFQRHGFAGAVLFERDREAGDPITGPVGSRPNPGAPYSRQVSGVATVFVRSSKLGADAHDHEDECDAVCDLVLCALDFVCKSRPFPLAITESRLLSADDMRSLKVFEHIETWPGCAARIRFRVTTHVRDVDYRGAGPDTAVLETVVLDSVVLARDEDGDPTDAVDPTHPDPEPEP